MNVACPGCALQVSVAPEFVGQVLACPHCSTRFQVAPGAVGQSSAPPAASSPASAPVWRGDPGMLAAGLKLNDPAAPTPPAPPPIAVPRFKPIDPSAAAVSLTREGTLPELSLADAKPSPKPAQQTKKEPPTLTLTIILALSVTLSVCLSLVDFSPQAGNLDEREQARSRIATFYGRPDARPDPYQLLLRDAQRAHSRGDHATEQAKYREVLRLLRAENRSTSLTETHQGDRDLENAISIVLADEYK